jgi:hypothetical protein
VNLYRGGPAVVWYVFLVLLALAILTRWRGANALAGTGFRGTIGLTQALQGQPPTAIMPPTPAKR